MAFAAISTSSEAGPILRRTRPGSPWMPIPSSISSSPRSNVGAPADGVVQDVSAVPKLRDRSFTFLATEATESVVAEGRTVTHVAVKLRTATFFTRTKIRKLPEPTIDPADVVAVALAVLDRFELDRPVRLLGVRVVLELPA